MVTGLNGPRGVATYGAKIVYSVGDGSVYEAWAYGTNKRIRKLGTVPGGFAPAIDTNRWGVTYALTGAGGEPGQPLPPGSATLYRLRPGKSPVKIADIAKYQQKDPDPYNLSDDPTESNPFGVATLRDGSVLVADAAGNDLLRVWPSGKIKTVARLKPRVVKAPAQFGGGLVPTEAVATSVTVGSDGYYYVGELRGFPGTARTSQIWRIKPGSVNAVCDPTKPYKGNCRRYADGYTSIVDLAGGPRGRIAVVELAKATWLAAEDPSSGPVIGSLYLQYPGKHHKAGYKRELARGKLVLPAGTAINKAGHVFVSSPLFGPGAIYRVK
ncbi:ScyD/ScyE family protein [Kribbella sp. NPDC023855]|uniref:ScyD/ScyE family protein n=1 Tax=Kribbella sp. NPDC023855 TaxID=3154698 RepID=UPI0033D5ADC5